MFLQLVASHIGDYLFIFIVVIYKSGRSGFN